MGQARKRYRYSDYEVAYRNRRNWNCLWLECTGERQKVTRGMDRKMKAIIQALVISCFLYNLAFGAMLHTIVDQRRAIKTLISMSVEELNNYRYE